MQTEILLDDLEEILITVARCSNNLSRGCNAKEILTCLNDRRQKDCKAAVSNPDEVRSHLETLHERQRRHIAPHFQGYGQDEPVWRLESKGIQYLAERGLLPVTLDWS